MKLFGSWSKPKPVEEEAAFTQVDAAAQTFTPEAEKSVENMYGLNHKIMIVDDNPVVLKAFELKLKAYGFAVLTAVEGSAAVSLARHEHPDLIVLDLHFAPEVGSSGLQWSGFTIMQWMQRFNEAANIPVIIITSDDASKFREKAISAGAVACFQKPIEHEEFMIAVRRTLASKAAKAEAAKPKAA